MSYRGLFVGLTTLDCIYLSPCHLQPNQKIVALDYLNAAGGPATNAAVAFSHLGNDPKLLTVLGRHPLNHLIREDLANCKIRVVDLMPSHSASPAISSIIVNATTAERSIISLNALKSQAKPSQIPANVLDGIDVILIDGHQIDVSLAVTASVKCDRLPVVMDGGSWKPGLDKLLSKVDYAVCSANFYPPSCHTTEQVFSFLQDRGIEHIAITRGNKPILYLEEGKIQTIAIPEIAAIDTLGAGDIFHGAFCHYILQENFAAALNSAVQIASKSCQYFGTRSWLSAK